MAKAKFEEIYNEMIEMNKKEFAEFEKIHKKFEEEGEKIRKEFNEIGEKIVEIIRIYEQKLCNNSEVGGYGKYAGKLAEKFWDHVRKNFTLIDEVGVY